MPYSASLAHRVRFQLAQWRNIVERKMFGGVVFMMNGNLLVGIWHDSLIVRLGPEGAAEALRRSYVREFDVTGKPMKGWVLVDAEGMESEAELSEWLARAEAFVSTLPRKASR